MSTALRRRSPTERALIIDEYLCGVLLKIIASDHDVSMMAVCRLIKRVGAPMRGHYRREQGQ